MRTKDVLWNDNAPLYTVEYALPKDNINLKLLEKWYGIKSDSKRTMELHILGSTDKKIISHKRVEFTLKKTPYVSYLESISFRPTK